MDSFFSKGFKSSKCKMLIKLAVARIKLLRNKRDIQVKQLRREIANLLQTGQEPSARIRVEHIIREQNIMVAYEILDLFCELLVVRLPIIESQRQCPLDLKEAISSLIFAAPRCTDLPELSEIRSLFGVKYGKEFVIAAAELRPGCGVNRRIIEKLSVHPPSGEVKLKLLKEIAAEHNLEWDASNTEAELVNSPEDLLHGPGQFFASSEASVPALPKKEMRPEEEQTSVMTEAEPAKVNAGHAVIPVQLATKSTPLDPSSSQSHNVNERPQFVPFVLSLPGKFPHASQNDSPSLSSSMEASTEDPYSAFRTTGKMDYTAMPFLTQESENSEGHGAEFHAGGATGVAFSSNEGQKIKYADIVSDAQGTAEYAELAAAAARAAASLTKGQPSSSPAEPTGGSSSYGEDDADLRNPYSFVNPKLGGYEENVNTPMRKDAVRASEKPVFDDDDEDDYGGTDVLEATSPGKSRAKKQDSFGGRSLNNPSGLFNDNSRGQSTSFNRSQPGLPAQYDEDIIESHSEKEPAQEEADGPKLDLDFFAKKRNAYVSDDDIYGFTEIDHETTSPLNLEHLENEARGIAHQSFPNALKKSLPF